MTYDWHELYFRAHDSLKFDRFYGSHGGEGPVYYTAISRYVRDHGIDGDDRKRFDIFFNAVDAEHLLMASEEDARARQQREKNGNPDTRS